MTMPLALSNSYLIGLLLDGISMTTFTSFGTCLPADNLSMPIKTLRVKNIDQMAVVYDATTILQVTLHYFTLSDLEPLPYRGIDDGLFILQNRRW